MPDRKVHRPSIGILKGFHGRSQRKKKTTAIGHNKGNKNLKRLIILLNLYVTVWFIFVNKCPKKIKLMCMPYEYEV